MVDNSASTQIIHRHMKRRFEKHRDLLEKHKEKGPAFQAAVEALEQRLFPPAPPVPGSRRDVVEGFAKKFGVTLPDDTSG